jgi:lipopolysaccharide export system permease protein
MTRILLITATRIGDAVLYSGVLDHLSREYPDADITVACGPLAAPLFRAVPEVSSIVVMTKKKRGGHWFDFWRQVRGVRWDLVVDLRGSITGWFLLAQRRKTNRRKPGAEHRHRVIEAADVLDIEPTPAPRLWFDEAAIETAKRVLPSGSPILAISPSAAAPYKEWPADRFAELINQLTGEGRVLNGARIALFGGPGDVAKTQSVAAGISHAEVVDLAGQLDILEAGAALGRARLFIGNDSGLMHMAAAAGVPTLGLFGPTDEGVYGPWGELGRSVRVGKSADENERGKLRFSETSLMDGLTLDAVYDAALKLFEDTRD